MAGDPLWPDWLSGHLPTVYQLGSQTYLDDFCTAYIDDVLIFSSGTRADHREKVKKVLHALQEAGLQLDIDKCEFETKSVKYLGFIIEAGIGIKVDPEKISAIAQWEAPRTVKA